MGLVKEMPSLNLPNIEVGQAYNLKPDPKLTYCELQLPVPEASKHDRYSLHIIIDT